MVRRVAVLVGVVNVVAVTIYIAEYLLSLGFWGFVAFVVSAARRGGERLIGVSSPSFYSLCSTPRRRYALRRLESLQARTRAEDTPIRLPCLVWVFRFVGFLLLPYGRQPRPSVPAPVPPLI
jgi:hypothetical protein